MNDSRTNTSRKTKEAGQQAAAKKKKAATSDYGHTEMATEPETRRNSNCYGQTRQTGGRKEMIVIR